MFSMPYFAVNQIGNMKEKKPRILKKNSIMEILKEFLFKKTTFF